MGQVDNVVSIYGADNNGNIELDQEARRLVHECRQALEVSLPRISQAFYDKLDDVLFEMGERSENNDKQTLYLDAMREVRKARQDMNSGFVEHLIKRYDDYWRFGPPSADQEDSPTSANELSLIAEDVLEESLATNSMANRAEGNYRRDLFALAARFSKLMKQELEEKTLPIAPLAISESFTEASGLLQLQIDVKLVIFKVFEKKVLANLRVIYDEINGILIRGGVQPKLDHKIKQSMYQPKQTPHAPPAAPAPPQQAPATESYGHEGASELADSQLAREMDGVGLAPAGQSFHEDSDAAAAGVYNMLHQLLHNQAMSGGMQLRTDIPAVNPNELMGALSNIQTAVSGTEVEIDEIPRVNDIRKELLQFFSIGNASSATKAIARSEEEVIDIISMLFDFILEDRGLPDHMKVLLSRLQIPMVKVAVMDKDFFAKKSHPARKLLNTLAQTAAKWDASLEKESDVIYRQVKGVVDRILNEFDDDPSIFADISKDFSKFVDMEDAKLKASEERATQALKGKERLGLARSVTDREIGNRLSMLKQVPDVVKTLLEGPWKDVMSLVYLRNGPESEQWNTVLGLMDKVIWSVQPKLDPNERKRMLSEIPGILKDLRENMVAISYDQRSITRIFKELQTAHIACLRNEEPKATGKSIFEQDDSSWMYGDSVPHELRQDPAEPPEEVKPQVEVINDEHQQQAANAKIGNWYEFKGLGEKPMRLKLSWRSSLTDLCVFVNRQGVKAAEMHVVDFADKLRKKEVEHIEEAGPPMLVDRAMNAMVEALKRSGDALADSPV